MPQARALAGRSRGEGGGAPPGTAGCRGYMLRSITITVAAGVPTSGFCASAFWILASLLSVTPTVLPSGVTLTAMAVPNMTVGLPSRWASTVAGRFRVVMIGQADVAASVWIRPPCRIHLVEECEGAPPPHGRPGWADRYGVLYSGRTSCWISAYGAVSVHV